MKPSDESMMKAREIFMTAWGASSGDVNTKNGRVIQAFAAALDEAKSPGRPWPTMCQAIDWAHVTFKEQKGSLPTYGEFYCWLIQNAEAVTKTHQELLQNESETPVVELPTEEEFQKWFDRQADEHRPLRVPPATIYDYLTQHAATARPTEEEIEK